MKNPQKKLVKSGRPKTKKDKKLWKRFRKGDDAVTAAIYSMHYPKLLQYGSRYARVEIVEDAIQELFNYLLVNRQKLGKTNNIEAYLKTSLRRKLFSHLKHNNEILLDQLNHTLERANEAFHTEIPMEVWRQVFHACDTLPQNQFDVIMLKYFEDLRFKEIALRLDISEPYTKTLFYRGLKSIRNKVKDQLTNRNQQDGMLL